MLEAKNEFLQSIIEQICGHIGFRPQIDDDEVYVKQAE